MAKQPEQILVENQSNETGVMDVLCAIWRRRGIIFVALIVGGLIGIAAAANSFPRSPAPVTYYISLTGMEVTQQDTADSTGRKQLITVTYPNGAAFLPRDLLDQQVLERVKEKLGLSDEIPFRLGIGISFDAPWSEGIIRRYADRLAARSITQADIDALNLNLERDLRTANMSGLRIDVSPVALGVSNDVAVAIAKTLPQAWRDVYTERYRTLLRADLPNLATGSTEADLGSPAGIVAAQMKIVSMMRGLDMIGGDNRLASVVNSKGQTANDLQSDLRQFRTVRFEPFSAPVFASDDSSVAAYRKDLEMRLAGSKRNVETIDRTLQEMLNNPIGKAVPQSLSDGNVQMDGTMLSQVLGLAQRASLTSMMPDMIERRAQASAETARLENELVMVSAQTSGSTDAGNPAQIVAEFNRLSDEYRDLYSAAFQRLQTVSSEFYADVSTPASPQQGISTRMVALLIAPIALALAIAVIFVGLAAFFKRSTVVR